MLFFPLTVLTLFTSSSSPNQAHFSSTIHHHSTPSGRELVQFFWDQYPLWNQFHLYIPSLQPSISPQNGKGPSWWWVRGSRDGGGGIRKETPGEEEHLCSTSDGNSDVFSFMLYAFSAYSAPQLGLSDSSERFAWINASEFAVRPLLFYELTLTFKAF